MYTVVYRIEHGKRFTPGHFTDVTVKGVSGMPTLGVVVEIPDGTARYGRVISIERSKK